MSAPRYTDYLAVLAQHPWPAPAGFAGRTCYRAIPALELRRRNDDAAPDIRPADIEASLALLHARQDCQDFAMSGFVPMLYRYRDLLPTVIGEAIEKALLGAKYQRLDPGDDTCCWHTENHQILYGSTEYLVGTRFGNRTFTVTGRDGAWHAARARDRIRRWLDWRLRFAFSEWNSSCYYDEDAAALINLACFSPDDDIRDMAATVFHSLLLHLALNSVDLLPGGSQGRAYLSDQVCPDATSMAILMHVLWGTDRPPAAISMGAVLLAAVAYPVPPALRTIARDRTEAVNRERHGVMPEAAASFDLDPDRADDLPYFMGAGLEHHPAIAETRMRVFGGQPRHDVEFADVHYYRRVRAAGGIPHGRDLPHALGEANLYCYRHDGVMLSSAQDFRAGCPGYQQFIWSALLSRRAVVFSTNPAPAGIAYGRPAPWVGNGVLPRVRQHRNVLLCLHRVRPCPIYDQPPWFREDRVHAYFPRAAFDETVEAGGWCFGRIGSRYIALRPLATAAPQWMPPDPAINALTGVPGAYEWAVEATDCAWICEVASGTTYASFEAFTTAIVNARCEGSIEALHYTSPVAGDLAFGWAAPLTVNGTPLPDTDFPRFDTPHIHAPFGPPFML